MLQVIRASVLVFVAASLGPIWAADYVSVTSTTGSQQAEASEVGLVPTRVKFLRRNSATPLQVNYRISGSARSDLHEGHVSNIEVGAGGNYADNIVVDTTTVGGSASDAALVQATGSDGSMDRMQVLNPGCGYLLPEITVAPPVGGGTTAALVPVVRGGLLQRVAISEPGAGYPMPTVTISGGGGEGANARAILKWAPGVGGQIDAIELLDGGYGYISTPTVTITPATGTGTTFSGTNASATAIVDVESGSVVSIILDGRGDGYYVPPITITRGDLPAGLEAEVALTLTAGAVAAAEVVTSGTNYADALARFVSFPQGGALGIIQLSGPDFVHPISSVREGNDLKGSLTFPVGKTEIFLDLKPLRNGAGGARTVSVEIAPPPAGTTYDYATGVDGSVLVYFADADDRASLSLDVAVASLRPNTIPSARSNLPVSVQGMGEWLCSVTGDDRRRRVDFLVDGTAEQTLNPAEPKDFYLVTSAVSVESTADDYMFVNPYDLTKVPPEPPPKAGDTEVAVDFPSNEGDNAPGSFFHVNDVVVLEAPSSGIHVVTAIALPGDNKNHKLTLAPAISGDTAYGVTRVRRIGRFLRGNEIEATGNGDVRYWAIPGPNDSPRGRKTVTMTVAQTTDYQVLSPASQTVTVADTSVYASLEHVANAGKPNIGGKARITLSRPFPVAVKAQFQLLDTSTAVPYDGTNPTQGDFVLTGLNTATKSGEILIPAGVTSVDLLVTPRLREGVTVEAVSHVNIMLKPSLDFLLQNTGSSFSNPTVSIEIAPPLYTTEGNPVYVAVESRQNGREGAVPVNGAVRFKLGRADGGDLLNPSEFLDQDLTLTYQVTNAAGCVPGVDYSDTLVSPTTGVGSVTIPRGQQYIDLVIPIFDDELVEGAESITFTLSTATGFQLSSAAQAVVSILDDEPVVHVVSVQNARESGTAGQFKVVLEQPVPRNLTVAFSLAGSASEGADYAPMGRSVVIQGGDIESTAIVINPLRDNIYDPDESVVITLDANATVYTLGSPGSASLTIIDDMPLLEIASDRSVDASEKDLASGFIRVVNVNTGVVFGDIPFTYSVVSGSTAATPGIDYQALSGSSAIPAGEGYVDIPVIPLGDSGYDPDETVTITLLDSTSDPPAFVLGSTVTGGITIIDDTIPALSVTGNGTPTEGAATASFVITSSFAPSADITVSVDVSSVGAVEGIDYIASGTQIIPAGGTTAAIVITALSDGVDDDGETVSLTILSDAASPITYTVGSPATATLVINNVDDDNPPIVVPPVEVNGDSGGGCGVGSGLGLVLAGLGLAGAAALRRRQRREQT